MRLTSILSTNTRQPRAEREQHRREGRRSAPPTPASPTSPTTCAAQGRAARRSALPTWAQPPVRYQMCVVQAPGRRHRGRQRASCARPVAPRPAAGPEALRVRPAAARGDAPTPRGGRGARGFTALPRARRRRRARRSSRSRSSRCSPRCPLGSVPSLLRDPAVRDAIAVTIRTNAVANVLIVGIGTPVAYLLATRRFRGRAAARSRSSSCRSSCRPRSRASRCSPRSARAGCSGPPLGGRRDRAAVHRVGGRAGGDLRRLAVLRAPGDLLVRGGRPALRRRRADARRLARRGRSRRVSLPLAAGGLLAGWVLAFARGVGEFGATIVFAGNVRGETQTLTLGDLRAARRRTSTSRSSIGILLVVLSATVLLSYKLHVVVETLELDIACRPSVVRARRRALTVGRGDGRPRRPVGRRQDDRPARGRRACGGPTAGRVALGRRRVVRRGRAASNRAARAAVGRARLPGVRAVPAHDGAPERRLRRGAARARRRAARAPAASPTSRTQQPGQRVRRRAPARRARPRARARPRRAAARRAALGARRAHARERARRAPGPARRAAASRRCS